MAWWGNLEWLSLIGNTFLRNLKKKKKKGLKKFQVHRFYLHIFMDGWKGGGWMDGWRIDGWINGWRDGWING